MTYPQGEIETYTKIRKHILSQSNQNKPLPGSDTTQMFIDLTKKKKKKEAVEEEEEETASFFRAGKQGLQWELGKLVP